MLRVLIDYPATLWLIFLPIIAAAIYRIARH